MVPPPWASVCSLQARIECENHAEPNVFAFWRVIDDDDDYADDDGGDDDDDDGVEADGEDEERSK